VRTLFYRIFEHIRQNPDMNSGLIGELFECCAFEGTNYRLSSHRLALFNAIVIKILSAYSSISGDKLRESQFSYLECWNSSRSAKWGGKIFTNM